MSRILHIVTVLSSAAGKALNVVVAKLSIALVMLPDYERFCIYRESYQGKQEKNASARNGKYLIGETYAKPI